MNVQEEYTALNVFPVRLLSRDIGHIDMVFVFYLIRRIWWTHDGCLPVKEIIANRPSRALEWTNYKSVTK